MNNTTQTNTQPAADRFQKLETLRDEVKVRAHLLKADLKDKYAELEKEFSKITLNGSHDLIEKVRDGYEHIKKALINH